MSYRQARNQHDEISLWLIYSTYTTFLQEKKNYQPHSKNSHQLYNVITGLNSNICTDVTSQNTVEYSCIISHAQNTTVHHCTLLLMGMHRPGDRSSTVVKVLRYKSVGRWFDSRWFHLNFSLTWSFRTQYGLGIDSASNRNEYQEYFLGTKAAGA